MPLPRKQFKPMRRTGIKPNLDHVQLRRRRAALNRVGKKGKENACVNREKKAEHIRLGITTCELRRANCTPFENLTWSHDRKRRKMGKVGSDERAENMHRSVVGCLNCHNEVELLPPDELMRVHAEAIEMRDERRLEAA